MPYTSFRMIAYEAPTVTRQGNGNWESGWDVGAEPADVARIPVPGGLPNDARIRLKRMANVVDLAEQRLRTLGKQLDTTLIIFIMPEFYFRPPSTLGVDYSMATYPKPMAFKIFDALKTMFADNAFKHWLFVCGTVMWNQKVLGNRVYYNTAPCIRGGPNLFFRLVEKQEASPIDGVTRDRSPGLAPETAPLFLSWPYRRRRYFSLAGLGLGLEICLDHADFPQYRVLGRVIRDWRRNEGGAQAPKIDLHMITAGGITLEPGSVVAKKFGYVLRNDGIVYPPPYVTSELKRVKGFDLQNLKKVALVDDVKPTEINRLPNTHGLRVPIPPGRDSFPQQYVIYPKMGL